MTDRPSRPRRRRRTVPVACAVLVALVAGMYGRTVAYDFVDYDDRTQVAENALVRRLDPANLGRIFTDLSRPSYYPVRLLSFALDYRVWGLDPAGYHLTNVALHAANVLLVFALAMRVLGAHGAAGPDSPADPPPPRDGRVLPAALGAGLFAVHPVVVEPVAWIAGREELLMVLGALAALHAHVAARRAWDAGRPGRGVALHAATFAACVFAIMSNTVGAVVPALVVAYDLLVARGTTLRRLAAETGPLWLVAAAAVVVKYSYGDLEGYEAGLSVAERARTVLALVWRNARTLVWPAALAPDYPNRVPAGFAEPAVLLGAGVAIAGGAAAWLLRHRRGVLVGLVWFVLALGPALQVLPHHVHRADRFLYLPLAGLATAAAAGLARLRRPRPRLVAAGLAAAVLAALAVRAAVQVPIWRDTETLARASLRVNPASAMMRSNLGLALIRAGRVREAKRELLGGVTLEPGLGDAWNNLGMAYEIEGDLARAARAYAAAIEASPDLGPPYLNLGTIYGRLGRLDDAARMLAVARERMPWDARVWNALGLVEAGRRRWADAVPLYREALARQPDFAVAHAELGRALAHLGRTDEALEHLARARALAPEAAHIHQTAGLALLALGRPRDAARAFREALRLDPAAPGARRGLSRALEAAEEQP